MPTEREDVSIPSHGESLSAWLYKGKKNGPVVILGHGIGGVKEMRLDAYAERFNREGYWCIAFDHRHFGGSTGKPRQLIDISHQQQDWHAVIKYARSEFTHADGSRICLFGTSFGGGHVIAIAAQDGKIAGVISQCPFTSGIASSLTVAPLSIPRLLFRAIRDQLFSTDERTTTVPLAAEPGQVGLMNSPDALEAAMKLVPDDANFEPEVAARLALWLPMYMPGRQAKNVNCPILFGLCDRDSVAPASTAEGYAKQAPRSTIKHYDCGHFDPYIEPWFSKVIVDYVDFLKQHVPVS